MGAGIEPSVAEVLERAHKQSVRVPPAEQARFVQEALGSRLAAAALGLKDTRTLSSWARGGPIRGGDSEHRLQVLFRVVTAVTDAYTPAVAAAFLRGSNPTLGDRAPMIVLADQEPTDAETQLLPAVEALLTA
jgi:hypothetical protein